jgi:hypothetical protein
MKANKISKRKTGRRVLAFAAVAALAAAAVALAAAYGRLRGLWLEQSVVTDFASQVRITDGRMVRSDVVALGFGLKNGANLALIDFEERRREMLKKIPNIREITISRHLPNRVEITVEERTPVVRLGIKGRKDNSGRVADTDGVVFISSSGTQMLPTIRERPDAATQKGKRLGGMPLSALRLIETSRDRFPQLGIIEVDASKSDYVTAVFADDYVLAKIAWDGMQEPSDAMMPSLVSRLDKLTKAVSANIDKSIRIWNATQDGPVCGNTNRGFL